MLEKQWDWAEELTQFALEREVIEVRWLNDKEVIKNLTKKYELDEDWTGFYYFQEKVILINLLNLKTFSEIYFQECNKITFTSTSDDFSLSPFVIHLKTEEEMFEQLSFFTFCHEFQHHIQFEQDRLDEGIQVLESEADGIASKCLMSYKKQGNLDGIKDLLIV